MKNNQAPTEKLCVSLGDMPFGTCMQMASLWPLVEIRLDLLQTDSKKIDLLAMQCRQWIATCRPAGNLTERDRTVLLSTAIRSGATYVDIEYEADADYRQPLIDLAKKQFCKIIISYHNYETTPDIGTMNRIIRHSTVMGADLVKIAVTAISSADCARVMSLYEQHKHLVAFAMGDVGKITRIAAPLLGAIFTFASVDEAYLTAPGQLTVEQMKMIYRILN